MGRAGVSPRHLKAGGSQEQRMELGQRRVALRTLRA
jgi:hypothetical protein